MSNPEEFSPLGMYGRKEIFKKRFSEGYTEVAFGGGDWAGDERIVRLWVFYHPSGKIATYEHPKFYIGAHTIHGNPFEAEYNANFLSRSINTFQRHIKKYKIELCPKKNLLEILQKLGK